MTYVAAAETAPLLLSISQSAHRLGVSRATIYRAIAGGQIKSVRLGGRRLIAQTELERFVSSLGER